MPSSNPLFRSAALAARRTRSAGEIVLVSPVSYRLLAAAALAMAAAVAAFAVLGSYTQHVTLQGQLIPERGLIVVNAPQRGIVLERHVVDGAQVRRGDVLFVVSSERTSAAFGATHAHIGRELDARRRSLETQIHETRLLEQSERDALVQRRTALGVELDRLAGMIADQVSRVAIAEEAAQRYARIHEQGFVSTDQLLAKREQLLDQRSRLGGLERDRAEITRRVAELDTELEALPRRVRNQIAELERAVAGVDLEIAENEARRQIHVVATADGTAAAIGGEVGQVVDAGAPLVSILPSGARLEVQLLAPSRAIGFVDVGDSVLLRYPAYPYQKFGHHPGRVAAVSRAALPGASSAVDGGERGGGARGGAEPVYRIVVEPGSQSVNVYGEVRALRAGMLVEAEVELETRRLYEWVLEPLYRMRNAHART